MKKGKVYLHDCYAGLLTENENGFTFVYDPSFLQSDLAETAKIAVVPHGQKVPMEDMCQLTERLTEYKYKGSYEQDSQGYQKILISPAT